MGTSQGQFHFSVSFRKSLIVLPLVPAFFQAHCIAQYIILPKGRKRKESKKDRKKEKRKKERKKERKKDRKKEKKKERKK